MIRRSTWVMLLIFGAVLGGGWLWSKRAQTDAAQPLPTPEALWSYDETQVEGLRVEDLKAGEVVEVHRDPDTGWRVTRPDEQPADAGRVEQAVTWLRSPNVSRVLTGQPDLAPFGLDDPVTRVTLILQDGSTPSFDVGAPTGIAGSNYIRIAGGEAIQVVSGYSLADVTGLLGDPPVLPPTGTPEPTAAGGETGGGTPAP